MSHKNKNEKTNQNPPEMTENPLPPETAAGLGPETRPEGAAAEPARAPETDPSGAELAALKDRHARLMADFDNYRKRQLRERGEVVKRANENLLEDLLPFLDTLDIALSNGGADDPFVKGVRMAADQLGGILSKNGMAPVEAAGAFDPNAHEAVARAASDTVPEGGIILQTRRGWTLNGRLLRAAQVVVSAGAAADGGACPAAGEA